MKTGQIRIIGGQWRGRILRFPSLPSLRPTPDRVRETLFNWLMRDIQNASCLDLFSGSGALGLEALSRGAKQVVFVDESPKIIEYLKQQLKIFNTEKGCCLHGTVPNLHIPSTYAPFDIVFLDPPFRKNLPGPTCEWLEKNNLVKENSLIYVETESECSSLVLPPHWEILKTKTAGQVTYRLIVVRKIKP